MLGDGRELVVTDDTAVKLRAEDGRSVRDVDISLFINDLPDGARHPPLLHDRCERQHVPGGGRGGSGGGRLSRVFG